MKFENRYARNLIFTDAEQKFLKEKKVAILGLGGLGGYVFEELVRIGVGHIIACDYDVFSETNLNRQLLSTEENIDKLKAEEAVKRAALINSEVEVETWTKRGDKAGLTEKLNSSDLVIDCLDTELDRLSLENICEELKVPLIHGAIDGWFGQISTVLPGDKTLEKIYQMGEEESNDIVMNPLGNVAFTAATVASIEVSEAIKVLIGEDEILQNKVLMIDLLNNEFKTISL